jgi:1,4-dihydroxy-2-naphthoate octaprenyltransferase
VIVLRAWLSAARLRTLPLAGLGPATALVTLYKDTADQPFFVLKSILVFAVAWLLQLLSNFANDYGDFMKGTDNAQRIGPERALQKGSIRPVQMLRAIWITGALALMCGLVLLAFLWQNAPIGLWLFLLTIGLVAIWAAVAYTMGKKPYGYAGWGEVAVFVFFGLVSVLGTGHLFLTQIPNVLYYNAIALGSFSAAVLHINNMRDVDNDRISGKWTLATRLGWKGGRMLHVLLVCLGAFAWVMAAAPAGHLWPLAPGLILAFTQAFWVVQNKERKKFDIGLRWMVAATFLTGLGYLWIYF